jgi:hypothetical protein
MNNYSLPFVALLFIFLKEIISTWVTFLGTANLHHFLVAVYINEPGILSHLSGY